jgi:hypothetical protein
LMLMLNRLLISLLIGWCSRCRVTVVIICTNVIMLYILIKFIKYLFLFVSIWLSYVSWYTYEQFILFYLANY